MKIVKMESSGIVFESYEGTGEITSYKQDEVCNDRENECYTPVTEKVNFSIRPETENGALAKRLQKKMDQEVLVRYRYHRIEPVALGTNFEILEVNDLDHPTGEEKLPEQFSVEKTGSKRNYYLAGRILRLEYVGTVIGTYEGIYLDSQRGKVHPFSITSKEMAEYAWKAMLLKRDYVIGLSQAYVTGFRESHYDLFEVNLNPAELPALQRKAAKANAQEERDRKDQSPQ